MASKYVVASLTLASSCLAAQQGIASDPASFANTAFDFIVVGGGTGGLTVASRLADNPKFTVGVIEAGLYRPNDPLIDIPGYFRRDLGDPNYDWKFVTVPQVHAGNQNVSVARGKALGGTSAVNAMVFGRASVKEYEGWKALGNPGWGWDDLLPYFKKLATYHPPSANLSFPGVTADDERAAEEGLAKYEGTDGPIHSSLTTEPFALNDPYVLTANKLGVPTNRNPEYGNSVGIFNTAWAINPSNGTRSYSASAYFVRSSAKPNFLVLTGAQATKIVFAPSNGNAPLVATGVEYSVDGKLYTVKAKKEVIVSAGTFQTPHILELSGVGNSTRLSKYGIKTLLNLPQVGENLQDKVGLGFEFEMQPGVVTYDEAVNNATYLAEQDELYRTQGKGLWATPHIVIMFTQIKHLISSAQIAAQKTAIDKQIASSATTALQKAHFKIYKDWMNADDVAGFEATLLPIWSRTDPATTGKNYVTMMSGVMHPLSRGSSHIVSADPLVKPAIDYNWLQNDWDAYSLLKVSRFVETMSKTDPYQSIIKARTTPPLNLQSDAQWGDYSRAHAEPFFHPVGSAAMAPQNLGGVVSPQLKVYGIKNVRVVDASVIPFAMATHPSQTIYAIGEKAADLIKADYQ